MAAIVACTAYGCYIACTAWLLEGVVVVPLYAPKSESEAAVIASLLHAYNVSFFMRGGAFSTMYPGSLTSSLNEQMLMVRDDHVELARDLLESFLTGREAI